MIELNEKIRNYIANEYPKAEFAGGVSAAELKNGVEAVYESNQNETVSRIRARAFAYVLQNAGLCVSESDYFADKIDHGDLLRNLRVRFVKHTDEILTAEDDSYFPDRESSAFFSGLDFGHTTPDWERLFSLGFAGILREAQARLAACPREQKPFFEDVVCVYSAVVDLLKRYIKLLRADGGENCLRLAKNLESLAKNPPQTLYEVLELTLLYYNLENNLECQYVRTLGKADQLWKPYYENDLKNGWREEELDALISAFFLRLHAMNLVANIPLCLGGLDKHGNRAYSDFSFKIVKIYSALNIFSPKIHIKYDGELPEDFLEFICRDIIRGNSSYLFIGDETVRKSLLKYGYAKNEVYDYEVIGCYEPYPARIELTSTCNGIISLPKNLELALNDGFDPVTKRQIGPHTGKPATLCSFESLFFRVQTSACKQLRKGDKIHKIILL